MKKVRVFALLLVILLVAAMVSGCSAPQNMGMQEDHNAAAGDGIYENAPEKEESSGGAVDRKLIRTVRIQAETQNLDAILAQLDSQIKSLEGYVESRQVQNGSGKNSGRYATLTLRIPAAHLDSFVNHVTGATNVTSSSENTEDVTLKYAATESKIKALETEEARLLELLALAKSLDEILRLEEKLADVRSELEVIKSQLKVYDNLVDYGTVHLSIREVIEYTEVEEEKPTVWQRISTGFTKSLKGLGTIITEVFVFFVIALPYLFIPITAAVVILIVSHVSKKKKAKETQEKQP